MNDSVNELPNCGGRDHFGRRNLLKLAGLSGLSWLTPLATALARDAERKPSAPAKSLIVLWLNLSLIHI